MLTLEILKQVVCGNWLIEPSDAGRGITEICDDSRKLAPGALFLAIAGELTDGHKYVGSAVSAGAVAVLLQKAPTEEQLAQMRAVGCACIQVEDSLRAYQQLALWHRMQFPQTDILAITGSCGKTSTKEMCAAILEQRFPKGVLKTIGSTNNHFGVPRNLYRIDDSTRVAVIEMGTNHPGEIANLVSLAPPKVGVVCNIGHAHLEFFHDLHGVAREKSSIFGGVVEDGICVYPADAVGADILRKAAGTHRVISFGAGDDADVRYEYLGYNGNGAFCIALKWRESGEERRVVWSLGGAHMAANAACAAAAASAFGCTPDEVVAGLQGCVLPGARLEIRDVNGVKWVNDAFNSNPTSAHAAIDWFAEVVPQGAPGMLVLGDMLELGEGTLEEHKKLLEYARAKCPEARLLTVGKLMREASASIADHSIENFNDAQEVALVLEQGHVPGSWILLKSSHGIGLAAVAEKILNSQCSILN